MKSTKPTQQDDRKYKLRYILENNRLIIFKNVKIMKIKEKLQKCSRLEETKGTRQLNIMHNDGLDTGVGKKLL